MITTLHFWSCFVARSEVCIVFSFSPNAENTIGMKDALFYFTNMLISPSLFSVMGSETAGRRSTVICSCQKIKDTNIKVSLLMVNIPEINGRSRMGHLGQMPPPPPTHTHTHIHTPCGGTILLIKILNFMPGQDQLIKLTKICTFY